MLSRMRFAFYAGNLTGFDALSLQEKPLGGTETGIIRLSEKLTELGHEVVVFNGQENARSSKVKYQKQPEVEGSGPWDVFVSIRDWIPCFLNLEAKRRFFWSGDSYDQFPNFGLGDKRVAAKIDAFLTVSAWQAEQICSRSGFPPTKTFILKNGIEESYFAGSETRGRKRLIYSSTPYRGLEHLTRYLPVLKKIHPDLETHIFSGYAVYGQPENEGLQKLRKALEAISGVTWHGNKMQKELAREFMKSSILFYPCQFEETSCITALEAMAAGCVPLSSKLGALPETIGDAGILIEGMPGQLNYDENYLRSAHQLLTDDELWQKLSKAGKERAQEHSWSKIAQRFVEFAQAKL